MMSLHGVLIDPEQARTWINRIMSPYCRGRWENDPKERLAVTVMPEEDHKTIQQGKFLWGVVLKEISEQAKIDGVKYSAQAWHELGKRQFLPREKRKVVVAGKKAFWTTSVGTTQGKGVRFMSAYIERMLAYGADDLGVRFSEVRWENYRG